MRVAHVRLLVGLSAGLIALLMATFVFLGHSARLGPVESPHRTGLVRNQALPRDEVAPSKLAAPTVLPGRFGVQRGLNRDVERMTRVREEIKFAWDSYKAHAWGDDILRPMVNSRRKGDKWIGAGLGIIDALDTLYIAGLRKEFDDGVRWVKDFSFDSTLRADVPVFETTIRILGGLLGAYTVSGDPMLVEKAADIAGKMQCAFAPNKVVVAPTALWRQNAARGPDIVLAEAASIQMEHVYLSSLTKNMLFADKSLKFYDFMARSGRGMFGRDVRVADGSMSGALGVGGGSDSAYECPAKLYLMSGRKKKPLMRLWQRSRDEMLGALSRTTLSNLSYIPDFLGDGNGGPRHSLNTAEEQQRDFGVAADLAHTCHEMYRRSGTGLGPAAVYFTPSAVAKQDYVVQSSDYLLRPEAIETWFYMYRFTGDHKYREWGWNAFEAIVKHCKVSTGFVGLRNVDDPTRSNPEWFDNDQQSFLIAETFKYLYCLFGSEHDCPLDQWVFNTEAHPFPILDDAKLYAAMKD